MRYVLLGILAMGVMGGLARGEDRILVIPFSTINVGANQQWVGQAVQEALVADLGQVKGIVPVGFSGQVIVEDNGMAARLARGNGAGFAIRGSAQVVGENIRLTAQLIEAQSGNTVRTALVTGATGDLFKLEDELAAQICGATVNGTTAGVVATTTTTAAYVGPVVAPAPVAVQYPAPQVVVVPEPVYYPTYVYPYNYTYYTTGYGIWDVRWGRRDWDHEREHFRDHDRDHGGRGGRPGDRDERDRPGSGGGRGGPRIVRDDNPTALPIPTTGMLPIPTTGMLPILTTGGLPIPTRNDLPVPTRSSVLPVPARLDPPVPSRSMPPLPARVAPAPTGGSGGAVVRSDSVLRPGGGEVVPAVSRSSAPAMTPGGGRVSGGGRGSKNND